MREQLVKFLEKNYGDLENFGEENLKVDEYPFCNGEMHLENAKIVGNDECFDCDGFYQYALSGDKLYKAYFEIPEDEDGNMMELDAVDCSHAYKIVDVTDEIAD